MTSVPVPRDCSPFPSKAVVYGHSHDFWLFETMSGSRRKNNWLTSSKHKKVQTNAYLFWHGLTVRKISGKFPLSSHKTTLEQQINGKKKKKKKEREREKMREKHIFFWLSFYRLFSAWKIVGMTMACNRCDVMNIMWRKTETGTEEWQRKVKRWGRGAEREKERDRDTETQTDRQTETEREREQSFCLRFLFVFVCLTDWLHVSKRGDCVCCELRENYKPVKIRPCYPTGMHLLSLLSSRGDAHWTEARVDALLGEKPAAMGWCYQSRLR